MMRSLTLLFLLSFLGISLACDGGWIAGPFRSCYKFVTTEKATWPEAQGLCRDMGGHLATLDSQNEIFWMRGYRTHHPELRQGMWAGGYKKDGKWLWSGDIVDSPMLITDWAETQPDNKGGKQDCLQLFGNNGDTTHYALVSWFKFDDCDCGSKFNFICEKSN